MVDVKTERGSNQAPSSHPLREFIIELFDGIVLEETRKENKPLSEKPSWNSILSKLKNN